MPRFWLIAVVVGVLSTATGAAPEPAATPRLKLKTERVVIFKDGYGLVVKDATATVDAQGRVFTTEVPDGAVLGCFWAVSEDKKILAMRAEWDEKKELRPRKTAAISIAELLRANLGKQVSLELTDKTDRGISLTQEGKLLEILEMPAEVAPDKRDEPFDPSDPLPTGPIVYTTAIHNGIVTSGGFTPESIPNGGVLVRELVPLGGAFIVVQQENDRRAILPVSHVQAVTGGKDFATTFSRQEEVFSRTKRLSFDFGKEFAGKAVALKIFYFTSGLRWVPTYRVSGELKDKADLALQGELYNDVTDIDHATIDLVVGVPNFRFKNMASPLTLEQTMLRVLESTGGNYTLNSQISNSVSFDNRKMVAEPANPNAGAGLAPELTSATGEQDLFVYNLKDVSLKKGARMTTPLWQQSANIRHLYTYDINARRSSVGGGLLDESQVTPRNPSPMHLTVNQIWHQLELANTGKMPWTTGAALMLRESLPVGQDLLTYTPPGSKALLPVTVAVDLRGTSDEQEIERKPNALHFNGYDYLQLKKKGTITITSYRKEKSDMRITVSTAGKVANASEDGKIKLNDFHPADWDEANISRVNNHSDVVWEFSLESGATKTLTYETTFYVR